MTELLARIWSLFVAPASASPRTSPVGAARPVPSVALLCRPGDALATAGALALALARDTGAGRALVACWRAGSEVAEAPRAPAWPEARRLVGALAAHGIEAEASGRLARAALPDEPEAALATGARGAAVAAAPTVLALAGPRDPVLDRLIAAQDLVVVATPADGGGRLAALALESVAALGVPAVACPPAAGPRRRVLAAAGVVAPRAAVAGLAPALEAAR